MRPTGRSGGGTRAGPTGAAGLRETWRRYARAASHIVPFAMVFFVALEWDGIPGKDRDTVAYHRAAEIARSTGEIYEPIPPPGPHQFTGEWHYLYPPPLAALLSALPDLSYRAFDRAWLVLNLLAFWVLAAALARLRDGRWNLPGTLLWGAALFFLPGVLMAMHFGNIAPVVLALVALGLAVPMAGGLTLGLAAAFKVTPVWPLLVVAVRRPRHTLPGLGAAVLLAGGACLAVFGAAETVALVERWVTEIAPTVGQGQFWGESYARMRQGNLPPLQWAQNLSLSFLPVQLAALSGGWGYTGGPLPGAIRLYLTIVAIGAPLLAIGLTRRRAPVVQAAIVAAVAYFAAPIVRPYAIPVVLLVVAAVRGERERRRRADDDAPQAAPAR